MFGISGTELLIILFFGFLIFGPEKLPQMGRTVGRAIRQFRNASEAANKKFKEEVADPFNEAIAPYKEQVEESTKPFQEDINAINSTLNETKSMFTDPFKDIFSPTPAQPKAAPGAVIATGVATDEVVVVPDESSSSSGGDSASSEYMSDGASDAGDDPFAGVIDDAPAMSPQTPEDAPTMSSRAERPQGAESRDLANGRGSAAQPIPQTGGTVKKSLAASLYDLDGDEGGE